MLSKKFKLLYFDLSKLNNHLFV